MATVTGLTAERMLAIESASIVDGQIDAFGHLILTTHGGSEIDAGYAKGTIITGTIEMYGLASTPPGYASCDGASVLRTLYPDLAAAWAAEAIPFPYGTVDGTHMNMPDGDNLFPRGNTPGAVGGVATHTHGLTTATTAAHAHTSPAHTHTSTAHTHTSAAHTHVSAAHTHTNTFHSHTLSSAWAKIAIAPNIVRLLQFSGVTSWAGNNKVASTSSSDTVASTVGTGLGGSTDDTTPADTGSTTPAATGSTTPAATGSTTPAATGSTTPAATGTTTPGLVGSTDAGSTLPPYFGVHFIIKT